MALEPITETSVPSAVTVPCTPYLLLAFLTYCVCARRLDADYVGASDEAAANA
jgi:hypothetical protein